MVQVDTLEGGWLPVAQAAVQLSVSKHAVRRRIQWGELQARQVRTRYGLAWEVRLDGDGDACATVARVSREGDATLTLQSCDPHATVAETPDIGGLVALVRSLQAKAEAAAMWQARADLLAERLAAAESRILALMPPESSQAPLPSRLPQLAMWAGALCMLLGTAVMLLAWR